MFSSLSKVEIIIWATFTLLTANAFNLVTSKILLFGKELTPYEIEKCLITVVQIEGGPAWLGGRVFDS